MEIKNNVYYIGVLDKDIKTFDLNMELKYGTSYNSYLIKGSKYNALIDTVKSEFVDEYIKNIEQYIDIKDIKYLIVNHSEPDHSGAIEKLLELNPDLEICGTKMAIDFVRNILNFDFKSNVLTANDSIDLGGKELKFFAFPMLHWPDSTYTYLKEDEILFTCDSFGVHYASDKLYNDLEKDLKEEYKYYFDNILGPFKDPFLQNALKKISLIPIDMICPGHGLVIRKNPEEYIQMYNDWCEEIEFCQNKVTVCYSSSYGYTKKIAKALIEGLKKCDVTVKEYDLQEANIDEVKKEIATSEGIMLGSPTILSDATPETYRVMTALNSIVNKGMTALAFGSYAWSGEATMNINQCFRMLRFNIPFEPIKIKLNPSQYDLEQITKIGEEFGKYIIKD